MATQSRLLSLGNDLQLCILEAFDSPTDLTNYLKASHLAASVFEAYEHSVLTKLLKKCISTNGITAAWKNRHLELNPSATVEQLRNVQHNTDIDTLTIADLRYLFELCTRHGSLVAHALANPSLEANARDAPKSWKMPEWWRTAPNPTGSLSWKKVVQDLTARLYCGFIHLELFLRLGDERLASLRTVHDRFMMNTSHDTHWFQALDVCCNRVRWTSRTPFQQPEATAIADMLLVATVIDYERLIADLALRKMYRHKSPRKAAASREETRTATRNTLGPGGGQLLPRQRCFFQDLAQLLDNARKSRPAGDIGLAFLDQGPEEIRNPHRHWDKSEFCQLRIFDYIHKKWIGRLPDCRVLAVYNFPFTWEMPPFSSTDVELMTQYTSAKLRADKWSRKEQKVVAATVEDTPEKETARIARECTKVLRVTRGQRQRLFAMW